MGGGEAAVTVERDRTESFVAMGQLCVSIAVAVPHIRDAIRCRAAHARCTDVSVLALPLY